MLSYMDTQGAHHIHEKHNNNQLRTNIMRTKYTDKPQQNHLPIPVYATSLHILREITTRGIGRFSSFVKQYYPILYEYVSCCSIQNFYAYPERRDIDIFF